MIDNKFEIRDIVIVPNGISNIDGVSGFYTDTVMGIRISDDNTYEYLVPIYKIEIYGYEDRWHIESSVKLHYRPDHIKSMVREKRLKKILD